MFPAHAGMYPMSGVTFSCGGLPKWSNGADCKSVGFAFDSSNLSSPTTIPLLKQRLKTMLEKKEYWTEISKKFFGEMHGGDHEKKLVISTSYTDKEKTEIKCQILLNIETQMFLAWLIDGRYFYSMKPGLYETFCEDVGLENNWRMGVGVTVFLVLLVLCTIFVTYCIVSAMPPFPTY